MRKVAHLTVKLLLSTILLVETILDWTVILEKGDLEDVLLQEVLHTTRS